MMIAIMILYLSINDSINDNTFNTNISEEYIYAKINVEQ